MSRRLTVVLLSIVLLASACGSDSKVGDESLLDFKEQVNKERLGVTTTTAAAETATTVAPDPNQKAGIQSATTTTTTAAPTTTQPPTTQPPTTQAPVQFAEITINSDADDAGQFNPSQLRVFKGTQVRWTNKDSVPRSVESDDAKTFASGPIPPGGTFVLKADAVGQFNYHDGSRPYAVATLEVLPRG